MTEIKWDDSLSVGIELIDEQHKELIKKIKDLSEAVAAARGLEKVLQTLEFMIDYTEFHFSTEEKYMYNLDFPGRDAHKKMHEEFKSTLNEMVSEFEEEGATAQLSEWVNNYLINWLVNHIKSVDTKLSHFLQEKGFEG